ncbi:hypothetical protein Bca101_017553 [Brassica carinata]
MLVTTPAHEAYHDPRVALPLGSVDQGGWVPLAIAARFSSSCRYGTTYGTLKRVPGVGLVYTELASGVPHIFSHLITNLPAIHSVVVLVCVKNLPVYTVPEEERFLVKRIGPKNFHMFRCVARYGYGDLHKKDDDFKKRLFESLSLFVRLEPMMEGGCSNTDEYSLWGRQNQLKDNQNVVTFDTFESRESITPVKRVSHTVTASSQMSGGVDELEFINRCRDAGVVHIMGNTVVRARRQARFYVKIAIGYVYQYMRFLERFVESIVLSSMFLKRAF